MDVIIKPSKLSGEVNVPPSKSLAHRAIIAASLAKGRSVIKNIAFSEDIKATIKGMQELGAQIEVDGDTLYIEGGFPLDKEKRINANESGSTLRFLIPISMLSNGVAHFRGVNNLVNRPLDIYFNMFNEFNIKYKKAKGASLPLTIYDKLKPGVFKLRGDVSSQFISGLLFSLPLLNEDSKIIITTELESKGYVDMTIEVLRIFGIEIVNQNYKEFIIRGNQKYKPATYRVEGDYSQAAFFLIADAMGADIKIKGLNVRSVQGDKKILTDLEDFSLNVINEIEYLIVKGSPKGTTISFKNSPDLAPALSILASIAPGESHFIEAERLRLKESDRISSMSGELRKLGAIVNEALDSMSFFGIKEFSGGILDSHNDHRIAIALSLASLKATGEIRIKGAECVKKSYPDYWEIFKSLGGNLEYEL